MPIYEYVCADCEMRFEIRASDPVPVNTLRCPDCASATVRRYYGSVTLLARGRTVTDEARSPEPATGALRPTDPGALTRNVARRYANGTKSSALTEVAHRAERGDGPAELQEFVRGLKSERATKAPSKRTGRAKSAKTSEGRAR